jgi:hypothetical protein
VYARLAAACPDAKTRDELEHELSAPARGWGAVEADLWARVSAAPDTDDGG